MPILFGVILLDLIGFGIVIPILPFLSPELGADRMDIALIIVAYASCAGIAGPFWGRLSDRVGRKPVIMVCLAGAAMAYVMLGLASQLWMVYAARAFAGLMAGNFGVASAMIADITRPENRARGMGVIGAAFGLGLVLGPVLGGLLTVDGSFTLPCIVAGGMSVLAIIAAAVFLPESNTREKRDAHRAQLESTQRESVYQLLRRTGNRMLVFQYVLHNSCVSATTYLVPLWTAELLGWGAREVGILFGVQGAIMVVMQGGMIGPLVRVLGEWPFLRLTTGCLVVGLALAIYARDMPAMVMATFIIMTAATLCMPLLNAITTHRAPAVSRGRMMGTTSAASSWGRVVGPLLAGAGLANAGFSVAWGGTLCLALCYFAWVWRANRLRRE